MTNKTCRMDHLIIAALTLEQGVEYVRETLGVEIPPGGKHTAMATHNHVMRLGDDVYLEVIAADNHPDAQAVRLQQPRWFALDDPYIRQALARSPALVTWAVNTPDIQRTLDSALWQGGEARELSRGDLSWSLAMTEDGRLQGAGMLPYIIQWHVNDHPSRNMADTGVRLEALRIQHPQYQWLQNCLQSIGADHLVTLEALDADAAPRLTARFSCDNAGKRTSVEISSGGAAG